MRRWDRLVDAYLEEYRARGIGEAMVRTSPTPRAARCDDAPPDQRLPARGGTRRMNTLDPSAVVLSGDPLDVVCAQHLVDSRNALW
jgi:hypothetical protein